MMNFKPLTKSKIIDLATLMQQFYAIDNYPFDQNTAVKLLEEFIENENLGKAYLIYNENEMVGYVILTFVFSFEYKGKIAFLDELFILPNHQGKGIGKNTLKFIKEKCTEFSIKLIYLEVENHNLNAQKLYLSQDFEIHNRKILKHKIT